jgi:diguanylate cyclase (GGDEF)-like protein
MSGVDDVLRHVIFLLTGTFFVSWFTYALAFRRKLLVGALFSLSNLLTGSGVLLVSLRAGEPSYLYYPIADWAIIAGFTAIWSGIRLIMFPHKTGWGLLVAPLVLAVAVTAWLKPDSSSYLARAVMFNGVCAFVFLASFASLYEGATRHRLDIGRKLAMGWPLLFAGFMFAARLLQIFASANSSSVPLKDSTHGYATFLWVFTATLIMVNVSVITVVVSDLIFKLRKIADHDALTGIFNRRYTLHVLRRECERASRTSTPLSCIVVDIDHFKSINDRYGHDAGDVALQQVCRVFTQGLRATDTFGRQGGEEFMLICPDTPHLMAKDVSERLRMALQAQPIEVGGHSLVLTASFGVSTVSPGGTTESLLKTADLALYQAKRQGRNRVCGEPITPAER